MDCVTLGKCPEGLKKRFESRRHRGGAMFPSSLQYVQDYKLRDGMVTRQEGSGGAWSWKGGRTKFNGFGLRLKYSDVGLFGL